MQLIRTYALTRTHIHACVYALFLHETHVRTNIYAHYSVRIDYTSPIG